MRTRISENSPCRLQKAELRRVPQNPKSWVIGYHVCCPRCGFVSLAINGQRDLVIDEDMAGRVTLFETISLHLLRGAHPSQPL